MRSSFSFIVLLLYCCTLNSACDHRHTHYPDATVKQTTQPIMHTPLKPLNRYAP